MAAWCCVGVGGVGRGVVAPVVSVCGCGGSAQQRWWWWRWDGCGGGGEGSCSRVQNSVQKFPIVRWTVSLSRVSNSWSPEICYGTHRALGSGTRVRN